MRLDAGLRPGGDLLSQDLSSHYHWRCGVSLPGSEWDRVVPPRYGYQKAIVGARCLRLPTAGFLAVLAFLRAGRCCQLLGSHSNPSAAL